MNLKTKKVSPASPDVTTNSMMTEQQKKAVFKIVRRSLKGLRNKAHEDEANVHPSLFIQIKHWSQGQNNEAWRWKEGSQIVM